ncbi:hypothetical protein [Blastomonas sp.]|uniref:hypothetical protein n=1 Tax=Blastomonas sp. TaxID=1909299 RepID=UPI0026022AA9|nr:hypothetical protein [Blastomonas sp.]MDM7956220.1 hypothetical protein [Blastomonas sp.]
MADLLPAPETRLPATASSRFLVLCGVLSVVPGAIHVFLPDGGAGVIAGLDLARDGGRTIGLFAWAGATQIVWGLTMLAIALRYRALVPLALTLLLLERTLHALNFWVLKPGTHHPPESYAVLVALPIIALFLALALRHRG